MSAIDPSLFADVADVLGIKNPVIVEKDYYAVQLLKELSLILLDDYHMVFAGGTCLAKAYQNTYRMSEDIDIKLTPSSPLFNESKGKWIQKRRMVHKTVCSILESSSLFKLIDSEKRNEGKYQKFLIKYPSQHPEINALRPHLQLELIESVLLESAIIRPIHSLYAEVAKLNPEVKGLPCATIESIASEKFVALLRRAAAFDRDNTKEDDETLIRHVYDLHLINGPLSNINSDGVLVRKVIQMDVEQFGNQSRQFRDNPVEELMYGLKLLIERPLYRERYEKFIGPLVYHPAPANWDEAISTVSKLATMWLS